MALKAYWKFDEKTGIVFSDSSGNEHHSTDGSIAGFGHGRVWSAGVEGACRGEAAIHYAATHADFQQTSTYSIEAFIKIGGAPAEGTYGIFMGNLSIEAPNVGFAFGIDSNRRLVVINGDPDAETDEVLIGTAQLDLNRWYHVAVTAEAGGMTVITYINGVQDRSQESSLDFWSSSALNVGIGANQSGNAGSVIKQFSGYVDDLKFYDAIVSDTDIATHYASGRDSGPAIYLAKPFGDATTYDGAATLVQSLFPLVEDVSVYFSGAVEYGADGETNALLAPASGDGNAHTIWVTTDPLDIATPTIIKGRISIAAASVTDLTLKISKIKGYGTFTATGPYGGDSTIPCMIEDCLLAVKLGDEAHTVALSSSGGWIKGGTIAVVGASDISSLVLCSNQNVFNTNILVYSANAVTVTAPAGNKSTVMHNYGAGSIAPATAGNWTSNAVGNPNLVTAAFITANNEAPATIIARNAHLTGTSTLCIGVADAATATTTDIVGVTRA